MTSTIYSTWMLPKIWLFKWYLKNQIWKKLVRFIDIYLKWFLNDQYLSHNIRYYNIIILFDRLKAILSLLECFKLNLKGALIILYQVILQ